MRFESKPSRRQAMQIGTLTGCVTIASRDGDWTRRVADPLGIPQAYPSYEGLLADPEIEAVYKRCQIISTSLVHQGRRNGQTPLIENPIALTANEAQTRTPRQEVAFDRLSAWREK